MSVADTYACRMTAEGRGAIATLLVGGPHAVECVARHFRSRSRVALAAAPSGRILLGHWISGESGSDADMSEEVVACKIQANRVEIHCHGGRAAAHAILQSLRSQGCRIIEWTRLPSDDRIEQDVRTALASARTEAVAAILLDQQRGALAEALDRIDRSLVGQDLRIARGSLDELMKYERLGLHLTSPWRVAIVGPPNVGKSSLINAVVGFQRAIVFDAPGTTRDVVTASTAIGGWPVDFADTAGIHPTDDAIESAGVTRSIEQLKLSDLLIIVLDAAAPVASEIQDLLNEFRTALVVQNKIDLVTSPVELPRAARVTSATRGDGIAELLTEISERLIGQPPPSGTAIPFTAEQFEELRSIRSAVEQRDAQRARRRLQRFRSRPSPL